MTKGELVQKLKEFRFQDMDAVNSVCIKAADAMGLSAGAALDKAERALQKNKGAFKEGKSGIKFDNGFLRGLNIETLLGLVFWLYGWEDVLMPWKYYENAVKGIFDVLAVKTQKEDRKDAKIDSFRARRKARYNADSVTRYRERKLARLDARWITIGATPEDKEAGIPAGKGRHILIDDDGTVVSGAGGAFKGMKFGDAKSSSEEVKVDPSKVSTAAAGEATASAGAGKTGGEATGEGGSKSGAEPKPVEPKPTESGGGEEEKPKEKKLRIVSSGNDFRKAAEGADAETKKEYMAKMPGGTIVTAEDGTEYRKKTNGEWVINGHKKPQDIDTIAGLEWDEVQTPVDVFKDAVSANNAQHLRDKLDSYAVGTIIQFQKDGKWALERKNSGWVVTNSGGVWSGTNLGSKSEFDDLDTWKSFADNMDNWYITRRKDTPSPTKPDATLMDMFEKEAEKDDREFEDLLDRCEPGTEISLDGKKYTAIGKDGKNTVWAHDVEGDDYFEGDSWWLASEANKASSMYVGGKRLGEAKAYAEGRKAARADYEKYTTPEYLKNVCSLKHFGKKENDVRKTTFGAFSDDELKEANDLLQKLFDTAEYCARFDAHKIDSFVEKGLLNQFETGTTHGYHDPGHGSRYEMSHKLFGTELKKDGKYVDGKDFEKYGFMSAYDDINSKGDAIGYGNACLIFDKEAVGERATFTFEDSLGSAVVPGRAGNSGNSTIFGLHGTGAPFSVTEKNEFMKTLRGLKSFSELRHCGWIWGYCEMQYHGKMPISTVKEIILPPGSKMSAASQAKLDEYGIKVTYKNIGGYTHSY